MDSSNSCTLSMKRLTSETTREMRIHPSSTSQIEGKAGEDVFSCCCFLWHEKIDPRETLPQESDTSSYLAIASLGSGLDNIAATNKTLITGQPHSMLLIPNAFSE